MSHDNTIRFNDQDATRAEQLDFVPRERRHHIWRIIIAFSTTIALVFIAGYAPLFGKVEIYTPIVTILLITILCLYVVYRKQMNLDLVMSTEYQNMLFSQAFSLGASFALIVRRDGTIVHASDGMNAVFPRFDYAQSQALEGVFEQGVVRRADRERIMGAIHSNSSDRLIFPVINHYQEKKDYILTVEPLPRPSGYCLIRGREYLGQRAGLQMLPDSLRSTSIDKLDHLLATTDIALYTTDMYGRFEYINPSFERLFGYEAGEIIESKLCIHHLIFSMGPTVITEEYSLHDYVGEAVLLNKFGAHIPASIKQTAVRDTHNRTMGVTGTIIAHAN